MGEKTNFKKSMAVLDIIITVLLVALVGYFGIQVPFLFDLLLFALIPFALFTLGLSLYIKKSILIKDEKKKQDAKFGIIINIVMGIVLIVRALFTNFYESFRFVPGIPDNGFVYFSLAAGTFLVLVGFLPITLIDVFLTRKKLKSKSEKT